MPLATAGNMGGEHDDDEEDDEDDLSDDEWEGANEAWCVDTSAPCLFHLQWLFSLRSVYSQYSLVLFSFSFLHIMTAPSALCLLSVFSFSFFSTYNGFSLCLPSTLSTLCLDPCCSSCLDPC